MSEQHTLQDAKRYRALCLVVTDPRASEIASLVDGVSVTSVQEVNERSDRIITALELAGWIV